MSELVARLILRTIYPRSFAGQYGAEVIGVSRDWLADVRRTRGMIRARFNAAALRSPGISAIVPPCRLGGRFTVLQTTFSSSVRC